VKFSVIVAARNESAQIGAALKRLRAISHDSPMEVIVVDGGSDDRTVSAVGEWADKVVELHTPHRAAQWNAGAKEATGDLLFFLPADAHPPDRWQQVLEHTWLATAMDKVAATAFSVDYGVSMPLKILAAWSNARVGRGVATSDHGLCTTPEIFKSVGGFPDVAKLEDHAFCKRLATRGRIVLLPDRIRPASRRIHADGAMRYAVGRVWSELWAKPA
jgi:glycosyltransferase involved in cell wall biosynthesis